jgi:hypothetical protein
LGSSIYDFVIDEDLPRTKLDEFQKIIMEWCLDDNNKNILYKNGKEKHPGFKLYKAIARNVHNHTPQNQLDREIFKKFIYNGSTENINIFTIDR